MFTVDSKTHEVIKTSLSAMPGLVSDLIRQYQDMEKPANQHFAQNPDDPSAHEFNWHQFGIITHCKRFQEHLELVVPAFLEKWGIAETAYRTLKQEVDGVSKWQLLQLAALWHDVGKFTARAAHITPEGTTGYNFKGHEKHSGKLIRGELRQFFTDLHFTEAQIEYIASCSELHFELGKLRRAAQSHYTLEFAQSARCQAAIGAIIQTDSQFALEIGLCFLADNLSKVEVYAEAETDHEIQVQKSQLEAKIAAKNLSPKLINAAIQMPVNIKVVESYLKTWASQKPQNGILWLRLDEQSAQALKAAFLPQFAQEFYHHVTLAFDTPKKEVEQFIGQKSKVKAYAYARNSKVEAVRVDATGLPDMYGVPHITLSTKEGVKPFEVVAMLKGRHDEVLLKEPLELRGVIEFVSFSPI